MPIYKNETTKAIVERFQDQHGSNIDYRIEPGKSLKTEFILTNTGLTLVNAAPYYNPLQANTHVVTSTGVGDNKTIQIEMITKTISILNQSEVLVTAFLRSTSNIPGLNCYPNTERLIEIGHNVDQIIFQFSEEATIYVEERK